MNRGVVRRVWVNTRPHDRGLGRGGLHVLQLSVCDCTSGSSDHCKHLNWQNVTINDV